MRSGNRLFLLLLVLLPALLFGCHNDGASGIEGSLLFGDRPLAGASVEIYLKAGRDRTVQPFAVGRSDDQGDYRLQLPPGRYYIIAKQRQTTADGRTRMLMAECPGNPVQVGKAMLAVPGFSLREMGRDGQLVPEPGTEVRGRLMFDKEPLPDALVYLYTEENSGEIGPSYGEVVESGPDGRFRIALPAGRYWLAARKRFSGGRLGELQPGDLNGRYPGNPVTLQSGQSRELDDFPLHRVADERLQKRRAEGKFAATTTALTGRVLNPEGEPVSGVYLFAYLDNRMVGKPTYISDPSDAEGRYRLNLGSGGTFFVGARSAFGGPLEPGEWVGTYDVVADHRVEVSTGAVVRLADIEVREVW